MTEFLYSSTSSLNHHADIHKTKHGERTPSILNAIHAVMRTEQTYCIDPWLRKDGERVKYEGCKY